MAGYTFVRKDLGRRHALRFAPAGERWLGAGVVAVIGFYDGSFGPGTGSFLLFAFVGVLGFDFLHAPACAKVVNFAANLSALACFAATGHVLYRYGLLVAAGNVAGALVGAHLALGGGNRLVRGFFLMAVAAMILRFGWDVVQP